MHSLSSLLMISPKVSVLLTKGNNFKVKLKTNLLEHSDLVSELKLYDLMCRKLY